MQAGYIWALRDASVDGEASIIHVSLLTRVNVCAAGREKTTGEIKTVGQSAKLGLNIDNLNKPRGIWHVYTRPLFPFSDIPLL